MPAYSWSSSATCVMQHNAIPVFVDIDFDTMNIDVGRIEEAITPKTRAIIVVHLHGRPVDMDKVMAVADTHGLRVIEDACQAHGATHRGKKVGTLGHCAAFSLNQNKSLVSGEGGMFVTNDEAAHRRAQALWSFGEEVAPTARRDYHVYAMGWMYRNNDLTAAFGRAQLRKLDGYLAVQREHAALLARELRGTPHLILPAEPPNGEHNWYEYTLRFDMEALGHVEDARAFRAKIVRALNAENLAPAIWQSFILPAMTVFRNKDGYGHGCPWSCPHAQPVDYAPERFPMAAKHTDWHAGVNTPLRAPNDSEVVTLVAAAIRKVMANIEQLEDIPDKE